MLSNILLKISYDGTNYSGFQIQPNAPTIQACLEDALSFLAKERIRVTAAGRTDAGVHAKGQVVNFKSRISVPIEKLPVALNSILPPDIRVEMAQLVEDSFHARYSAIEKTYSYQVYQAPIQSCFLRLYSLWVSNPIDWEKVEQAGKMLIGKHDFKGFAATGSSVQTSVRTMKDFQIKKEGRLTTMYFTADGFLYHMVRNIVGTLLEIGTHKRSTSDIALILERKDRSLAGPTAPPQGLFLESVLYLLS